MKSFKLWLFETADWSSFKIGRQREFGFQHEPGYNRKPTSYLDNDITPEIEDFSTFNLYHVTTNLTGVRQAGRLKSRRELGIVGLGGGPDNEAPNLISTTYDYNRAYKIYEQIKFVAEMVRGQVRASIAFHAATRDAYREFGEEPDMVDNVVREFIPPIAFKKYMDGDETMLDKYIKTPEKVYEFFQDLEKAISEDESQSDYTSGESTIIGFTGTFEQMRQIDPNQVAIIQVVAKKGAKSQQITFEKELRFKPEDLKIIRFHKPQ